MNYQQSDLDLMKRDVDEYGVEALLTPESLKLLIADLEEARTALTRRLEDWHRILQGDLEDAKAREAESRRDFYVEQDKRQSAEFRIEELQAELQADKERLDWQEKNSPCHSIILDGVLRWHEVANEGAIFRGTTFREALDAARAGE